MINFPSCHHCPDRKEACHVGCERAAIESILHTLQQAARAPKKRDACNLAAVKTSAVTRVKKRKSSGRCTKYPVGQK